MFGFFLDKSDRVMKRASLIAAIFLLSGIVTGKAVEIFPDLKIVKSDHNGIVAEYTPKVEDILSQKAEGINTRLFVPYHANSDIPGTYPTAQRRHLLAVPPGATASLQVTSVKSHSANNVTLEKIPFEEEVEQSVSFESQKPAKDFVTISKPFRFRRFQVVEIIFTPALYNPATKSLTIADDINFIVNINGGSSTGYGINSELRNDKVILNYNQAAKWMIPPAINSSNSFFNATFVKIPIYEEGIYKITYDDLSNLSIDIESVPLAKIRLFNNGGRELPVSLNISTPDSLIENAIYVKDNNNNNVFDTDDYILFYGKGVSGWQETSPGVYSHYINHYTNFNTYWLDLSASGLDGKRMTGFGSQSSPSLNVETSPGRLFLEEEKVIYENSEFPGSGLNWYGDFFSGSGSRYEYFSCYSVASGYYKIKMTFKPVSGSSKFNIYWNNQQIAFSDTVKSSNILIHEGEDLTHEGSNSLKLELITSTSIYVDWYEIEYERSLTAVNGSIFFEAPVGTGAAYFNVEGLSNSALIFKISDYANVKVVENTNFTDDLSVSTAYRYCAYNLSAVKTLDNIYLYTQPQTDFTDLRAPSNEADYLYITHSDFSSEVDEVVDYWQTKTGLTVKKVDISQVFDEFSWGLYDPVAIRNFLRYAMDNWAKPPYHVALVGDGDYDYRNISSDNDKNWIPPYEAGNRCFDDFFVTLHNSTNPEIALGRYTVTSPQEAGIVVDKVKLYSGNTNYGSWHTRFVLVADDEYKAGAVFTSEYFHSQDSELLDNVFLPDYLNVNKVYLMDYPIAPGEGGRKKPAAADALIEKINRGAVLVNYYGHGNEYTWADEHVLIFDRDFPRIQNGDRLTIFVAATCDWAYFDNPERQSFPEELLVAEGRGAIASIASNRLTTSGSNRTLAENFYTLIFDDPVNTPSLGAALLNAKLLAGSSSNNLSYHIIGDPMIRPRFPRNYGEIVNILPDSLFAVNIIKTEGKLYLNNQPWEDFNGNVYLEAFDASLLMNYEYNGNSGVFLEYDLPGKNIFRGPFSANGSSFESNFIVPLDITYGGELGRISLYFWEDGIDGAGYINNIYIGAGGQELIDSDVPSAEIYFGDRAYQPGDPVSSSPVIIADLVDSSGLNLTGSSGHEIALIVDDNLEFDITDYFEYNIDSYRSGTLVKQLDYLPPGVHNMKFRVWDSFNHPQQLEFTIETVETSPTDDYLYGLLNYPNPFKDETALVFHTLANSVVEIEIYTVGGRKIKELPPQNCLGYVYDQFYWDGRDEMGDKVANGVYLYKVKAVIEGEKISKIGKMILMR